MQLTIRLLPSEKLDQKILRILYQPSSYPLIFRNFLKMSGQAAGKIIQAVVRVAAKLSKNLFNIAKKEEEKLEEFTQGMVNELADEFPDKNILIVADNKKYTRSFQGEVHEKAYCDLSLGRKWGFDTFVFDTGSFELQGDGGFRNWAFKGRFTRNGNHVEFTQRIGM
jgi:hypothetical protein